jgi:hypothetical protein
MKRGRQDRQHAYHGAADNPFGHQLPDAQLRHGVLDAVRPMAAQLVDRNGWQGFANR